MKRLYRSRSDRMIAGICGGLAAYFKADPTLIRLLAIILMLVTAIMPVVLAYGIGAIIIPNEEDVIKG